MNIPLAKHYRRQNYLHSVLLLIAMLGLLALIGWFGRILFPGRRVPAPSLLRTHPTTQSRVRRLNDIAREFSQRSEMFEKDYTGDWLDPAPTQKPRRHISGLWY